MKNVEVLAKAFVAVFVFVLYNVLLYYTGLVIWRYTPRKVSGHYMVAVSGVYPRAIVKLCPYTDGKCRIWNCPEYGRCKR